MEVVEADKVETALWREGRIFQRGHCGDGTWSLIWDFERCRGRRGWFFKIHELNETKILQVYTSYDVAINSAGCTSVTEQTLAQKGSIREWGVTAEQR